ncbi:cytochrome P450 [Zychaea mexicana]|uniref:cytochrome P450 n=1 Tax=Zychaea mexicana TaxID=64656 RepID=UPI0022FF3BC3|nr:cytochrome P450 [Zychaea mexicana]KAI9492576.1 cytochrome P450 [Zychaea mexicana]
MTPIIDTKNVPQIAAITTSAAVGMLGLLAIKYNDRAIFDERRTDLPFITGEPLIGTLGMQLRNKDQLYEYQTYTLERLDTLTATESAFGLPPSITTLSPANVEHFLKTNFGNYIKGQQMRDAMGDLFGHGIFVANGDQWRYQRKAASLIFNVKNFKDHFVDVFVKEVFVMTSRIFDKKADNGKPVDFHDVMYKFTLDSFVEIGFGVQLNALASKDKVSFADSFDQCQANCMDRFINPFMPIIERLQPILHPRTRSVRGHLKVVDNFAYKIIGERRKQIDQGGDDFKDLLSRFMSARNENGKTLNDKELRDTVLNFIIAGRDTTAQALSWTFYNLMLHPRVEAKLLQEINEKVRDEHELDTPALYSVIGTLTYAHAVFYEVLRLYPSVPSNIKVALEDDVWPDGTHVRKGDSVVWSPYSQGRSTKVWGPDAKDFKPERWLDEHGNLRRESAGQWPAFHAGPRICLGQQLATLEAIVAIVMLLRRYKFSLAHDQEITYMISLTMPMKSGLQVFVERR